MSKTKATEEISRRQALKLIAGGTLGVLTGCAVNPVTGEQQLMLVSKQEEIQLDKQNSPHQFSADYGAVQDSEINQYVTQVGQSLAATSHRPDMPYNFRCVNANYVNAYAFPGGSIACTRGIMLKLENEAELAALIGHEIGHVNARHTAARMSSSMATQGVLAIGAGVLATQNSDLAPLAAGLGGIGASLLLANYSRADERQADSLGMNYMNKAGYDTEGMVGLMDELNKLHKTEPSFVQQMFASHPMSRERYDDAVKQRNTTYAGKHGKILRERYMDNIASIRKIQPAIEEMQKGEESMSKRAFVNAEEHFSKALKIAPSDYVGLLLMSKCQMAQNKNREAIQFAEHAKNVYPAEAQALQIAGILNFETKQYKQALVDFNGYDKRLPGNSMITFFKGISYEALGNRRMAASEYYKFLQNNREGKYAKHAYGRLSSWGYTQ
ncbi:M48 family metalloprotease [Maridesulfovibrio ferrireducens]|uniref:M48 family metalloprotease n=1 Tax=Maridesulfovibrio ferrireducens TaxID=246191 RepID=UPI001A317CF3|nr:M48 family metalloprotease [Maridesulfovibrio ferrireducens]MBI9111936.1 M48 family metalloprotease [Maridesulfovibrio ferrireducens]